MSDLRVGHSAAVGYEALPKNGTGPGVLVLHSWWRLNPFFREVCDRLSAAGWQSLAIGVPADRESPRQLQTTTRFSMSRYADD